MNKEQQIYFIKELVDNVKTDLIAIVSRADFPTGWDGIELRNLIADRFALVTCGYLRDKRTRRARDYANECIVKNLI